MSYQTLYQHYINIEQFNLTSNLQRKTKKMMGSPRCGTQPEKGSCAAGRRQGRWNKIGYLSKLTSNACIKGSLLEAAMQDGQSMILPTGLRAILQIPTSKDKQWESFVELKRIILQVSFLFFRCASISWTYIVHLVSQSLVCFGIADNLRIVHWKWDSIVFKCQCQSQQCIM